MWTEIKRKLFHLIGLAYVIGILTLPRRLFVQGLIVLLLVTAAIEFGRLRSPRLNTWFLTLFGGLFRVEEMRYVSGIFWMQLGVLSAAVLLPPPALAATAVLYLILGDGVASLAGKKCGGPSWPSSPKRITGSLACYVACLLAGAFMLRPHYGWTGILVGAFAATLFEFGVLPLNDNLQIPLGASIVLMICYGVRPEYF